MLRQSCPAHLAQRLQAIHLRHDHIQQHSAQALRILQDHLKTNFTVFRLKHIVIGAENLLQNGPVDGVVIYD